MWISAFVRKPPIGSTVLCRLKHDRTHAVQEHRLVHVNQDDCAWRTADDNSEISYSWTVIVWFEE